MNELDINKRIAHRINILTGHSGALLNMLEEGRKYKDVFLQVQALKGSIKGIEELLIEKYTDELLLNVTHKDKSRISEIISLLNKY